MSAVYRLDLLTRDQLAAIAGEAVVVIPLGSMEQHGAHLPLATDAIIAEALAAGAAQRAVVDRPLVLVPTQYVGSSDHHLFAAAYSFTVDTYQQVLRDCARSLRRSGFRRLIFINGHGGNDLAMRLVSNDLILSEELTVAACSYWTPETVIEGAPEFVMGHAGVSETAMMLHLAPELVGAPDPSLGGVPAIFDQVLARGVLLNRFGEWARIGGVTERSSGATAALGAALVADRIAALARVIERFAAIEDAEATA